MNLADYLSELLEENTEVSVPGLGYFVREHIGAYYNQTDARFYPPYHQVKFIDELRADDVLVEYIAGKKNISIASSKYFAEKFVNKLLEDAAGGKQLFSNLGSFQLNNNRFIFEPNRELPDDPDFYGFPPVDIIKLPAAEPPAAVKPFTLPLVTPDPAEPPVIPMPDPEYYNDEPEEKRISRLWIILPAIVLALSIAAFIAYKMNGKLFNKYLNKTPTDTTIHKTPPVKVVEVRRDTIKDTTAKVPPPADTLAQLNKLQAAVEPANASYFELLIGKYQKGSITKATLALKHFRAHGIDANIVKDVPGTMIRISAGRFDNLNAADSAMKALLKVGKITKKNSEIKKINTQK